MHTQAHGQKHWHTRVQKRIGREQTNAPRQICCRPRQTHEHITSFLHTLAVRVELQVATREPANGRAQMRRAAASPVAHTELRPTDTHTHTHTSEQERERGTRRQRRTNRQTDAHWAPNCTELCECIAVRLRERGSRRERERERKT